jgi:hypothetical protein
MVLADGDGLLLESPVAPPLTVLDALSRNDDAFARFRRERIRACPAERLRGADRRHDQRQRALRFLRDLKFALSRSLLAQAAISQMATGRGSGRRR